MIILSPYVFWLFLLFVPLVWVALRNFRNSHNFLRKFVHMPYKEELLDIFCIKKVLGSICLFASVLFILLALAGFARREFTIQETNCELDIVFVLDISNSMLAQDRLNLSRLEEAKKIISDLASRFQKKAYNFSLVAFKGRAEVFLPLTQNFLFLNRLLESITPLMIESRGSQVFLGLKLAREILRDSIRQKVVILLTDGQDLSSYQKVLLQEMNLENIHSIVIGLGDREPIAFKDSYGNYVIDTKGRRILSAQEITYLKRLAKDCGGFYINAFENGLSYSVLEVEEYLFSLGLKNKGLKIVSIHHYFLLLALAFALLQLLIIKIKIKRLL